jgi:hypothetical protein
MLRTLAPCWLSSAVAEEAMGGSESWEVLASRNARSVPAPAAVAFENDLHLL